jgi:A/G-specific adenine glycosylase
MVSEFMLQQTQVATVLPYYKTFLERFPTLAELAEASDESVRAAWSGLGYYRRARNLQAAAQSIVQDHAGRIPSEMETLKALPGVGDYTAAALGSIVHDLPTGVVDGNVIRVLTRLTTHNDMANQAASRRALQDLADRLVDPEEPGDWNQGMMELGATICTTRAPRCPACPWTRACRASAQGNPEAYPRKPSPRGTVSVEKVAGILRRGSSLLLTLRHDPKLLDETWELPGVDHPAGRNPRRVLADHLESLLGKPVRVGAELATVNHAITHRRIRIRGFAVSADRLPRTTGGKTWVWVNHLCLADYPISSMTSKMIRALEKPASARK